MRKKIGALLYLSLFLFGISSEAVLMGYESFNYPTGSLNSQNDPNDGFKYAWSTSGYTVDASSLSMPSYPLTPAGGAMSGSGGAIRSLNFEGLGLDATEMIDFSQDQTRYLSVMMKRTPSTWLEMILKNGSFAEILKFGLGSNNQFALRDQTTSTSVYGGDCSTSNAYFVVLKIVSHASGNDEIFLKGYSDSDIVTSTEPDSWTAMLSADLSDTLAKIDFSGKAGYVSTVDEIVIGTTWADVAPGSATGLLIAYESFDYPVGSLNGQNDLDDGFKYAWATGSYSVDASSLNMPNYPLMPVGGAMSGSGGAVRTLAFAGLERSADELIDFSLEQTRYLSMMMKRTPATWFEMILENASATDIIKFGLGSNNQFALRAPDAGLNVYGGDCSTSNAYFIVLKMVAHTSADDEIFLQGYSSGDVIGFEPTNWTATVSADLNDVLTRMDFSGKGGYVSTIDEIVIGTSWDVVAPLAAAPGAAIVDSLKPYAGNVWEVAVSIANPWLIDSYFPVSSENLVAGSWTNIAHSIDGNAPFIVTNLSYSTDSGSNNVIYVEADDAARFFRIDAVEE